MRNVRIQLGLLLAWSLSVWASVPGWAQGDRPQMYLFTMQHCPPCREMEPAVERLLREGYPLQKIDCQTQPQCANHFQITQTPTIVLVRTGQPIARHVGPMNYADLVGMFHAVGFSPTATAAASGTAFPATANPTPNLVPVTTAVGTTQASATASDPASFTPPQQLAWQATVRLKVEDPTGTSYGTGTIIHRYQNAYLVLTCGHIFRESQGGGVITVDHGFGTNTPSAAAGKLLGYDAEARDVGLVVFESPLAIQPVRLAPQVFPVQANDPVFTVGCNHGADPTLISCQIIRTALYDGAKKYDTTVRPVDGRSGGGLFSPGGQLIGICNAAAVEQDEGIFSSLDNIFSQLQAANLAHLFGEQTAVASASAAPAPAAVNQSPSAAASPAALPPAAAGVAAVTQAPANDLEMIVIVRSKSVPSQTQTYTISNPTSDDLARLATAGQQPAAVASDAAAPRTAGGIGSPPLVIRGQSNR